MAETEKWMIYGATGYTGQLIADVAVSRGLKPTLAGRNPEKVRALAEKLDLPWAAFSVDDANAVEAALKDQALVLSVAGPFSATAEKMIQACLKTGTHYLDVTGEIAVFEHAAVQSDNAKAAGVMLLPGVGFDVVPSDCLAAHTAARTNAPEALTIAIKGLGGPSQGTAKTAVEALGSGTAVRRNGEIKRLRAGANLAAFDLGAGEEEFMGVSWGDVSTAYYSTGIGNIDVYFPAEGPIKSMTKMARLFGPLMNLKFVQNFLKRQIEKMPAGPSEAERERDNSILLAEVTSKDGSVTRSILETPNGYTLTADSAVKCALKTLGGSAKPGFQTPSLAFGAEFINEIEGCSLRDL